MKTVYKQLNVRVPEDQFTALEQHVKTTGEKQSDAVRRGIQLAIGAGSSSSQPDHHAVAQTPSGVRSAAPPEDREGSDNGTSNGQVELATWLAGRTGMPRAIMARRITAGKVEVDGRVRYCEKIDPAELRNVTLDGNPL